MRKGSTVITNVVDGRHRTILDGDALRYAAFAVALATILSATAANAAGTAGASGDKTPPAPPPPPASSDAITHHTVVVDGKTLAYAATAGTITLKDPKGNPTARMFYVGYTLDGVSNKATRPVTFLYNGGP